jgi:hypothetical protein
MIYYASGNGHRSAEDIFKAPGVLFTFYEIGFEQRLDGKKVGWLAAPKRRWKKHRKVRGVK